MRGCYEINLIKSVESNILNNIHSKFWNIFVWSSFLKLERVLIHQISLMKNIQSKVLNRHVRRKNSEN